VIAERTTRQSTVVLSGDLDSVTQEAARAQIASAGDADVLVIDLRRVTFMDVSGMRLLIEARMECDRTGRTLRVVRGSRCVHRLLSLCGVEGYFDFVDEPEAPLL
jgi:anti-anti-sigma factor